MLSGLAQVIGVNRHLTIKVKKVYCVLITASDHKTTAHFFGHCIRCIAWYGKTVFYTLQIHVLM